MWIKADWLVLIMATHENWDNFCFSSSVISQYLTQSNPLIRLIIHSIRLHRHLPYCLVPMTLYTPCVRLLTFESKIIEKIWFQLRMNENWIQMKWIDKILKFKEKNWTDFYLFLFVFVIVGVNLSIIWLQNVWGWRVLISLFVWS